HGCHVAEMVLSFDTVSRWSWPTLLSPRAGHDATPHSRVPRRRSSKVSACPPGLAAAWGDAADGLLSRCCASRPLRPEPTDGADRRAFGPCRLQGPAARRLLIRGRSAALFLDGSAKQETCACRARPKQSASS